MSEVEAPNFTDLETIEEHVYRVERVKTHLKEMVGVYVDDQSWDFLNKIMSLSNDNMIAAVKSGTRRLEEDLRWKMKVYYKDLKNEQDKMREKIKELPWYKRLFNQF